MKIAVFGAGAIGGYLGALLSRSGHDVTMIARGATLAAIRDHGLRLEKDGSEIVTRPRATDDPHKAGPQDYVVVALKTPAAPAAAPMLRPMLGADTAVVTAMNGMPWWYFHKVGGELEGHRLETVDPGGAQWREIGPERVIGSIMWIAVTQPAPGHVRHVGGLQMSLGEPDGSMSPRVQRLAAALEASGVKAPINPDIRSEIWAKLLGNFSFNPVSALTGGTLGQICADPGQVSVAVAMIEEALQVTGKLGLAFDTPMEKRVAAAAFYGNHKTSMLQDIEAAKPMEIDGLVGAVAELGRLTGVATPTIDTVLALLKGRARTMGLYQ